MRPKNYKLTEEDQWCVNKFIKDFCQYDKHGEVAKTFLNGYCYWFSKMLDGRFLYGEILYEPVEGHFVYKLYDHYYDIRGDVTEEYAGKKFYTEEECLDIPSIVIGCMTKIYLDEWRETYPL